LAIRPLEGLQNGMDGWPNVFIQPTANCQQVFGPFNELHYVFWPHFGIWPFVPA